MTHKPVKKVSVKSPKTFGGVVGKVGVKMPQKKMGGKPSVDYNVMWMEAPDWSGKTGGIKKRM